MGGHGACDSENDGQSERIFHLHSFLNVRHTPHLRLAPKRRMLPDTQTFSAFTNR